MVSLFFKLQEEHQLTWDQREVELERQLDHYEKHQNAILSGGAEKVKHCFLISIVKLIKFRIGKAYLYQNRQDSQHLVHL